MNYSLHYERFISKARNRSILKSEYKERHHIIPRCMGGTNDKENLIDLFPEEHWLAHLLLVKIHPENHNLIYAVNRLTAKKDKTMVRNNKMYGWLKKTMSTVSSTRMKKRNPMHNETIRKKVGDRLKGRTAWNKGLDASDERVKKNIYERSDVCREKSRQARLGKTLSDETKQLLREQRVGKPNFKNAKEVMLISPCGEEIIVKHKIASKCKELGLSYKALNKYRNEFVPPNKRQNSFLREATTGWCLKDLHLS